MAAEDFFAAIPTDETDEQRLGVPPLPPPPQLPVRPVDPQQQKRQQLQGLAAIVAALTLGPSRGGVGVLSGLRQQHEEAKQEALRQQQHDEAVLRQQQQFYQQEQLRHEAATQHRGEVLKTALTNLGKTLATVTTKEQADAAIDTYANGLAAAGYRGYDANALRAKGYRFLAPDAAKRASDQLTRLMESNKELLERAPDKFWHGPYPFDWGDKLHAGTTPLDLAKIAGRQPISDPVTGQIVVPDKPMSPADAARLAGYYDRALKQLVAEGKDKNDLAVQERASDIANQKINALRPAPVRDPLAQELAAMRLEEAKRKAEPIDITADVQTTRAGRRYVDLSLYQGETRNRAQRAAAEAGITTVSKEQAEALQEVDNARLNQADILTQIESVLPRDAAGRLIVTPRITLQKLFQTNARIAAYQSWRTAAIQTLRATAGSKGLRINQAEIAQAIQNDLPKLTDTVPTARQKVANINTMLENAERSILVRDRSALDPAATGRAILGLPSRK